ncbi:MAG: response regulator/sensor histidine kinase HsfB, partial [Myxococcaceae bacterium]|nr:response regulator/sensor histidine kinase HsfB [Myxococcaceae bacterium]
DQSPRLALQDQGLWHQLRRAVRGPHVVEQQATRARVVVVDDDSLVLAVARRVLDRAGYDVAVYEDVQRALGDVTANEPFAVVADLNMPGMGGSELLQRVLQISPASYRLLYTGEGQAHELERALAPGLTHAVVSKMAGPRALPDALDQLRRGPR